MNQPQHFLISRTDNLGDVMLTLPMAGVLKEIFPACRVSFLGKAYTLPLVERSSFVDACHDWDILSSGSDGLGNIGADTILHVFPQRAIAKAAKAASIALRIGTSHRLFHWSTCNKLVNFGRKNSPLHEAELNLKLLKAIGVPETPPKEVLHQYYGWPEIGTLSERFGQWLHPHKFNLLVHTRSKGSASEWRLDRFLALIETLPAADFQVFLTGTASEGEYIRENCSALFALPHVTDVTGAFDLDDFIDFVRCADGLLACSTGPLHIAAAAGIHCLGLYPSVRPMHPGRWAPLGAKAAYLTDTAKKFSAYLDGIPVEAVRQQVVSWAR